MAFSRPGSVTAAGVLAIVYGSLFTLCGVCGVAGLAMQGGMGGNFFGGGNQHEELQKQLQAALVRDVPAYEAFQIAGTILGLALALALLVAGIGLLSLHRWARTLGLAACSVTIVSTSFSAIYTAALVIPAMNDAFQVVLPAALPVGGPEGAQVLRFLQTTMTVAMIGSVAFALLQVIYLSIIVYLLRRADVRAAFDAAPMGDFDDRPPADTPRRDDEEDWPAPPRRDDPDKDWHVR